MNSGETIVLRTRTSKKANPLLQHVCAAVNASPPCGCQLKTSAYHFAIVLFAVTCFLAPRPCPAGTIYYFEDHKGVLHFTDMPDSRPYQPFLTFDPDHNTERSEILVLIRKYSRKHQMDPKLVQAVLEVESDYDPLARSSQGAQGLMQIMPETQEDLGLIAPYNPEANIEAGVRYLKQMLTTHQSLELALAAYNAGPGMVEHYQGVPPFPETKRYIEKVLQRYNGHQPH